MQRRSCCGVIPRAFAKPQVKVLYVTSENRASLTDKVYQYLSGQLAGRALAIGDRINPRAVAEQLDVSRTTINKALARLEAEGWLTSDDARRPIVTKRPGKRRASPAANFEFSNRTDATYEAILERILKGELQPSEIVKERPLGQTLGVNPATVRRAAEWLCNDGLMERLPRRGWRVATVSAHDLKDIYQIRVLLEPLAIKGTVARMSDEVLADLERETRRLITQGEKATVYDRRRADLRFHQAIAMTSGNRMLAATIEPLVRKALLVTTVGFRYGRASQSFEEHLDILRALKSRDGALAAKRLKSHLRQAQKFNLELWERQSRFPLVADDSRSGPPGRGIT